MHGPRQPHRGGPYAACCQLQDRGHGATATADRAVGRQRTVLKNVGLAAALTEALVARGVPDSLAHLAAELGVLAFKRGFAEWSAGDRDAADSLAPYTLAALDDLREASASLG